MVSIGAKVKTCRGESRAFLTWHGYNAINPDILIIQHIGVWLLLVIVT